MKKLFTTILLFLTTLTFSKNLVLTSNQATYTITKLLTKNTSISVKDVFETTQTMGSDQAAAYKEVDKELFKEAIAIVDLQRVWSDDMLYEQARRENIHVIEIDASYSYQDNSSLALLIDTYHLKETHLDNTKYPNPYVWLNLNNLQKMVKIVAHDLTKIFPEDKDKIKENLDTTLAEFDKIIEKYNEIDYKEGVIVLSENLSYLVSFLNIYNINMEYTDITKDNIKKIIDETGLKIFFTERPIVKDIKDEIEKNGGKVVVLKTGNFPEESEDDEDLLNEVGLINILNENLEKLKVMESSE